MKKIRCIFMLVVFCLFMPSVYAFTFDVNVSADNLSVNKGSISQITVSLKELNGVSSPFGACSFKIEYGEGIMLNGNIKGLDGWSLISSGSVCSFDTAESFTNGSKIFSFPVKINNESYVKITNIECSDGETKESILDKTINFTISDAGNDSTNNDEDNNDEDNNVVNNNDDNNSSSNVDDSDENINNEPVEKQLEITLTEGSIDFDPLVFEYTVEVQDIDNFDVVVNLGVNDDSYSVEKNISEEEKNLIVTVVGKDESVKLYKINLIEDNNIGLENMDTNVENNKYVPIFIGIICLLVLINVFRIVRNLKK